MKDKLKQLEMKYYKLYTQVRSIDDDIRLYLIGEKIRELKSLKRKFYRQ